VRLCGAAANAAAVYKPTPTLLTHADYVDGAYEISIVASAANGFAAGNTYAIYCSLTISAVNPNGFIGLIILKPAVANLIQVNGAAQTATLDTIKADSVSILAKLLKYVQLLARKDAAIATDNATELTAINASGGSGAGAFSNQTDAEEALRDRGDAAWATATGFAIVGSQMNLADDAITAGKYDESTAFPLKAADAGSTYVARSGADGSGIQLTLIYDDFLAYLTLMQGLGFDTDTDSLEAIRDRGDAAWATATGFSTLDAADVNAEMEDVLAVDVLAEPAQGAPPATPTMAEAIAFNYFNWRNKHYASSTEEAIYDNAGTTKLVKRTISDDATSVTKGKFESGA
jgi:hypothetical protein